jgi:hypothetical protein
VTGRRHLAAPRLPNLTFQTPVSPGVGEIYFDAGLNAAFVFDGTVWQMCQAEREYVFQQQGTLTVKTGTQRLYRDTNMFFTGGLISVTTPPTGANLICDINKNGTTIYTTQGNRPQLGVGTNYAPLATPDIVAFTGGDYITIDVDQVGSTIAGADMVLVLRFMRHQ